MNVIKIDKEKLIENGFAETEYGFKKNIPGMFRFSWNLYVQENDIYGTVEGKMGRDEVDDYEAWLKNMKFRNPDKVAGVEKMVADLIKQGAITVQE